jgi:hypothetical protein
MLRSIFLVMSLGGAVSCKFSQIGSVHVAVIDEVLQIRCELFIDARLVAIDASIIMYNSRHREFSGQW